MTSMVVWYDMLQQHSGVSGIKGQWIIKGQCIKVRGAPPVHADMLLGLYEASPKHDVRDRRSSTRCTQVAYVRRWTIQCSCFTSCAA